MPNKAKRLWARLPLILKCVSVENLQGPIIVAFNTLLSIPRVHIFIDTSGGVRV